MSRDKGRSQEEGEGQRSAPHLSCMERLVRGEAVSWLAINAANGVPSYGYMLQNGPTTTLCCVVKSPTWDVTCFRFCFRAAAHALGVDPVKTSGGGDQGDRPHWACPASWRAPQAPQGRPNTSWSLLHFKL